METDHDYRILWAAHCVDVVCGLPPCILGNGLFPWAWLVVFSKADATGYVVEPEFHRHRSGDRYAMPFLGTSVSRLAYEGDSLLQGM